MKKSAYLLLLFLAFIFIQCDSDTDNPTPDPVENPSGQDNGTNNDGSNSDDDSNSDDGQTSDDGTGENQGTDDSSGEGSDTGGDDTTGDGTDPNTTEPCDNEDAVFDNTGDSESPNECSQQLNNGTISCTIDGVSFESTGILASGVYEENDDVFTLGIIGGDGPDPDTPIDQRNQRGVAITISSSNLRFDDLQTDVEYSGTNGVNILTGGFEVFGAYVRILDCENQEGGGDFSPTAKIQFSKIDRTNQLLSGTFELVAFDEETGNSYVVSQGTFVDLWYCNQAPSSGKSLFFINKQKQRFFNQ
ncbi:hypothetical protein [Maribacter cobaltidurans]|uniref:Uncharacterized protein n=1 Tax=Maribacter cobaltidurans TaxID=1178778 RepID=A0A223V903_9FLAO|nr:hypothetical protein [Maribacter cobaltidurans]ASV31861.1 hypothetical protein CJ263_17460 [Maribacter cobaltidurans]GGD85151.1 hypothetical protein GCM10011412_23690 [Maribacter cobaltidurans]